MASEPAKFPAFLTSWGLMLGTLTYLLQLVSTIRFGACWVASYTSKDYESKKMRPVSVAHQERAIFGSELSLIRARVGNMK